MLLYEILTDNILIMSALHEAGYQGFIRLNMI